MKAESTYSGAGKKKAIMGFWSSMLWYNERGIRSIERVVSEAL